MMVEIFSKPFCKPFEQTKKPRTTIAAIQIVISKGLLSMVEKTAVLEGLALKVPFINLKK